MDAQDFEKLSLKEQEQIFHKSSFRDKAELILHAHDPGVLARSLSQEELYLLTREMDLEERVEVIRHASLPQLFFISDVDCWKKDRLDRKSFVQWLETLLAADERKLLAWLMEMDYEAVVAGFYQLIQVMKPDHEWTPDEVLGDTPYFTLDQMYYIFVSEENLATVRRAIEVLFENHRGRYAAILEGILGELEDELEEEAFSRRSARLAGRGFPDFESANRIYKPITIEEFQNFPLKNNFKDPTDTKEHGALPNYIALWSKERFFLDDVLHSFHEAEASVREGLQEELAWLSNKVIVGDGADLFSEDKVQSGIERARGFLNIGLELLSEGDFEKARTLLQTRWLEIIFRWGFTQVYHLRERVRAVIREGWNASQVDFLKSMDSPYETVFAGLLRSAPAVYDENQKGPEPLRLFRALSDVARTHQFVDQIEKVQDVILSRFAKAFQTAKKECALAGLDFTVFRFWGTLFVRFVLTRKVSYAAVLKPDLARFVPIAFEQKSEQRVLRKNIKDEFSSLVFPEKTESALAGYSALFFDRFEDEFSRIQDLENIHSEFISVVFLAPAVNSPAVKGSSRKKPTSK